jgi:large subunit ribosomal protein L16
MLEPKKPKHRTWFKGKRRGIASAGHSISFGEFGLQSQVCGWTSARELEAARRAITGYIKRKGKLWLRVFPDKPITKKPNDVKMGKGKGDFEAYVAVIKPGRMLFELGGVDEETARGAFKLAAYKLSVKTRFIKKEGMI